MPTKRRFLRWLRTDGYLLGEVVGPFFGGVAFFLFIFLMFQALRLAEFFIVHGVSAATLGKMVLLLMLSFLPMALPVAFLVAVLVAFGRLSSDSEIVALKASGFSLTRLTAPVAMLAVFVVVFSSFLNLEWVPYGERASKELLLKIGNSRVVSSIKEGTFTSGFFDLLIFADKVDSKTNRMKRVFIYDDREPKNPLTVVAQTGEVVPVKTANQGASAIVLRLFNGSIHRNDPTTNTYTKIDFGEYKLYLKLDEGTHGSVWRPQMLPVSNLLKDIRTSEPNSGFGREVRGEFWRRIATSLTPLFFVLVGIGFGTIRTRAVRAGAALVAFVTLAIYWVVLSACTVALQKGVLPPWFAMQVPNLLVAAIGAVSFRRAAW